MRKALTATSCLLLAVAVLLAGVPAQAGELMVVDPAGDATGVDIFGNPEAQSTPRPSDAELDILGMAWRSDGTNLKADLKLAKVGHPVGSIGFTYRLNFTHAGQG